MPLFDEAMSVDVFSLFVLNNNFFNKTQLCFLLESRVKNI